jgi:ornithine cyclodeaminase/alanine dehydrogenase-like protein (mu-crystallin family)
MTLPSDSHPAATPQAGAPGLLYLSAADVTACLPDLTERLRLAEQTLLGLVEGAELPPKIGVHPRPAGSFAHAMPAYLPGPDPDGSADLVGMKWIAGVPDNPAAGLPALHALVVVNDPRTGVPLAILDGGPITAERTAAVSGVAIARWAPPVRGRAPRAAIVGAGTQGRAHVPILGHLLPGLELAICDLVLDRAARLAADAIAIQGIAAARAVEDARQAVGGADVVVTCVSFGPVRQVMTEDWFTSDALVVAVDYATSVAAAVARSAALFLVDEARQFQAARDAGHFDGYPDPGGLLGSAIRDRIARPTRGRVLVTHLGVGLADLVFARSILAAATARGLGTRLLRSP